MLKLYTGIPGAGKTLNAIDDVWTDSHWQLTTEQKQENDLPPDFKRPVFFYGIKGCSVPDWVRLTDEQLFKWWELPRWSIIIIDEAYSFAPTQATGATPPPHIERLARHRHEGIDFVFIAQHATQLSTFLRKMVEVHYHCTRPFGFSYTRIYRFEGVQADPDNYHAKKDATIINKPLNKEIFPYYKSAEVHTHKARIPKKLYILIFLIFLTVSIFGWFGHTVYKKSHPDSVPQINPNTGRVNSADNVSPIATNNSDQLALSLKPRIANQPWSAPAYDHLTKPKSFPRPQCILNVKTDQCTCYTQQATFLNIEHDACVQFIAFGRFDHTKPDPRDSNDTKSSEGAGAGIGETRPPASPPVTQTSLIE